MTIIGASREAKSSVVMEFADYDKSLQQLDGRRSGEPTFDSHLVGECHRLRRVPLNQLRVEAMNSLALRPGSISYSIMVLISQLVAA